MAKKFLTEIDLDNNKAINVANPTNDQDAATKKYVDDNAGGDHGMAALAPIEVSVSTAASTAAKVGTTSGGSYTPTAGDVLLVTFSASNTANNATLNVDGSGAKNIQTGGVNTSNISLAGTKVLMWYDGTRYQLFGSQRVSDTNTTYSEISEANIVNAASATAGTITGRRMEHYKNTNLIIDEDDMASDSATKMPSQQSVKAYVDTGLSGKQDVITGGASSIVSSNLTPERALVSSSSGKVIVSNVTDIELEYLDGVTSAIQTQLDGKYNPANIVGSVSESSGVPTGAIVETGSNANGTYTKWADGTMICHLHDSPTLSATTSYGSLFIGTHSWTFPETFASSPAVTASVRLATGASWAAPSSTSTTNASIIVVDAFSRSSVSSKRSLIAIGRWF